MVNYNQQFIANERAIFKVTNRAFKYGDAVFETLKVYQNNIVFAEEHYFRLMASMRMLRMIIPMDFTLEFFIDQVLKTTLENKLENARVRFSVFRKDGGFFLPNENSIDFLIEVGQLSFSIKEEYKVDLFKDYTQPTGLLSNIKTASKLIHVLASIFAKENNLDNCFLLNDKKNIVETINANVFLVIGNTIYTPSLSEGCLKGIVRGKVIEILKGNKRYTCIETEVSPFELLKADEVFITNSILGIQPISYYRKKKYTTKIVEVLKEKLSELEQFNLV